MEKQRSDESGTFVTGTVLVIVGLVVLLSRFDVLELATVATFWPLLLLLASVGKLLSGKLVGAFGFFAAGTLLQLDALGYLSISRSWPAFLVILGLGFIVDSLVLHSPDKKGAHHA